MRHFYYPPIQYYTKLSKFLNKMMRRFLILLAFVSSHHIFVRVNSTFLDHVTKWNLIFHFSKISTVQTLTRITNMFVL